jgi:hypothetical protein
MSALLVLLAWAELLGRPMLSPEAARDARAALRRIVHGWW